MNEDTFYIHLYTGGKTTFRMNDQPVVLEMETDYPWQEEISMSISTQNPVSFTLGLRIPGWCRNARLEINGEEVEIKDIIQNGYVQIKRNWSNVDKMLLTLSMPVERVESHPKVRTNTGRIALQRGPVVYCLEEVDNGKDLNDIVLPETVNVEVTWEAELFDGFPVIAAEGKKRDKSCWENELYRAMRSDLINTRIKAIPYFLWANRQEGEMLVWIRQV
jgi:DUF1680 family protein